MKLAETTVYDTKKLPMCVSAEMSVDFFVPHLAEVESIQRMLLKSKNVLYRNNQQYWIVLLRK